MTGDADRTDDAELLTTIIGRGHSATRAIAQSLRRSGIDMGRTNVFGDKPPYEVISELGRLMCTEYMVVRGEDYDFTPALEQPVPEAARQALRDYLADRFEVTGPRGWKLPETILVLPWLVRLYPDIRYIYWTRGVWDLRGHKSDLLLKRWGVIPNTNDRLLDAARSWKLQYDIARQTPKPEHWLHLRMEDFALAPEETRSRLEAFLEMPITLAPPKPDAVTKATPLHYDFTIEPMRQLGYDV